MTPNLNFSSHPWRRAACEALIGLSLLLLYTERILPADSQTFGSAWSSDPTHSLSGRRDESPPLPTGEGLGDARAGSLLASRWDFTNSPVDVVDVATGVPQLIGYTGFPCLNSLARNSSGLLFAASVGSPACAAEGSRLVVIDPSSGEANVVASLDFGEVFPSVRALAFSPADVLYALNDVVNEFFDDLWVIDVATGKGTRIGSTHRSGIQSLAFSPSGVLYGWNISGSAVPGLMTIDPATGATDDQAYVGSGVHMQSIAFDREGRLFGASTVVPFTSLFEFWRINPLNGTVTLISLEPQVGKVRGIEFVPPSVDIDVKPGGVSNAVNLRSWGVISVAILGSDGLDASDVDVTTLGFGLNAARPVHNLADPFVLNAHRRDVNHDGFTDLVSHYRVRDTGIACGHTFVTLTGKLVDGEPFIGTDSIRTIGCAHD